MASLDDMRLDDMGLEEWPPLEILYDGLIFISGHSQLVLSERLYADVPDGFSVATGLAASPGILCISNTNDVKRHIVSMLEGGAFGDSPQNILSSVLTFIKTRGREKLLKHTSKKAVDDFLADEGMISTNTHRYYNRSWSFDKPGNPLYGMVLLVTREGGIQSLFEDEIARGVPVAGKAETGNFRLTKRELLTYLNTHTSCRHPFIVDLSCSSIIDSYNGRPLPEILTREQFVANGIFGGKKKKSKRRRTRKKQTLGIAH